MSIGRGYKRGRGGGRFGGHVRGNVGGCGRGHGRRSVNDKVIYVVDISDPNRLFTN